MNRGLDRSDECIRACIFVCGDVMSVDLPNYRIVEKLGIGANSSIYRARCMRTGKDYAVKIVKKIKPEDESFIDLLRAEYAIGSTIDHSTVRKIYELRYLRQRLRIKGAILFMEYVSGIAMSDREFSRPLIEILGQFQEVARGLHAMHLAGYVHADLKPNNIMITNDDEVKLIDLGQSSTIREAKPRVQGTIDYMAPEQVNQEVLDARTDVFGLGATLHKVLIGKPIATDMNQTVSMSSQSMVGKRVSDTTEHHYETLPVGIARFISDCCQNDPDNRIANMPTLIERLDLAQMTLRKQEAKSTTPPDENEA